MPDLHTSYLGCRLNSPLVAAASPLTGSLDGIKALQDAGIGAITLPSLFEEQITHQKLAAQLTAVGVELTKESGPLSPGASALSDSITGHSGAPSYAYGRTAEDYLELVRAAKAAVDVPVIASMNGTTTGPWLDYAQLIEAAGADALELNIYYIAADPGISGAEVELRFLEVVRAVCDSVRVPVAIKIPPFFSAPAYTIRSLARAGAHAAVLFNRFVQPDIDLDAFQVTPTLHLSDSEELRMTLRWIAILHGKVDCELAATTGAHTAEDVLKLLLAGANVVTLASALLRYGPRHVLELERKLNAWLDDHDFTSVDTLRGRLSQVNSPDPLAYERASYMKALLNYRSPPE